MRARSRQSSSARVESGRCRSLTQLALAGVGGDGAVGGHGDPNPAAWDRSAGARVEGALDRASGAALNGTIRTPDALKVAPRAAHQGLTPVGSGASASHPARISGAVVGISSYGAQHSGMAEAPAGNVKAPAGSGCRLPSDSGRAMPSRSGSRRSGRSRTARPLVDEGLLNRMRPVDRAQPFERGDFASPTGDRRTHERIARPRDMTVQAPHWPSPRRISARAAGLVGQHVAALPGRRQPCAGARSPSGRCR